MTQQKHRAWLLLIAVVVIWLVVFYMLTQHLRRPNAPVSEPAVGNITATPTNTIPDITETVARPTATPVMAAIPTYTPQPTVSATPIRLPTPTSTPAAITVTIPITFHPIPPISGTMPITGNPPISGTMPVTGNLPISLTEILSITLSPSITPTQYADTLHLWETGEIVEDHKQGAWMYEVYKMGAYPLVFCAKKEGDTGHLEIGLRDQDGLLMEGGYTVRTLHYSCRILGNSPSWDDRPIFLQVDPVLGEGEITENLLWSARIFRAHAINERPQWGIIKGMGDAVFLPYEEGTQEVWGYYDSNEEVTVYKVCEGQSQMQAMRTRNRQPFRIDTQCYAIELRTEGYWTLVLTRGVTESDTNGE